MKLSEELAESGELVVSEGLADPASMRLPANMIDELKEIAAAKAEALPYLKIADTIDKANAILADLLPHPSPNRVPSDSYPGL